jgi:flagellar hook-basal body complex protein FliE
MTDRVDINRLMVEMRSIKTKTQAFNGAPGIAARDISDMRPRAGVEIQTDNKTPAFGDLMAQAVNKVNETSKASGALQSAYQQGDPNVDITEVMVASQKASVSFQAMLQVRNKLVEAYRDVMNMPI